MSEKMAQDFSLELQKKAKMPIAFSKFVFFKKNRESLLPLKDILRPQASKIVVDNHPDLEAYVSRANTLLDP